MSIIIFIILGVCSVGLGYNYAMIKVIKCMKEIFDSLDGKENPAFIDGVIFVSKTLMKIVC